MRRNMPAWTIRSATQADIPAVLALWRAARSPAGVEDAREHVLRLLAIDPDALRLAVTAAERPRAGGPQASVVGSLIATWDGWRGSFYRLAVHPEQRRRGVAWALLADGERHLREHGALRLTAIVADDEPAAIGFWTAAGYERQEHRARFVRQLQRSA